MIHKLTFSVEIKAEKAAIWKALWDEKSYRDWAGVFLEGSYAVSDNWKEGSKVHFLAPDHSGIFSIIEKHTPNSIIQFKHIGTVVGGIEQNTDEETSKWTGSAEIYTLIEGKDAITLQVEIDIMDEHLEFMKDKFPLALEKIKSNCSSR